MSDTALDRRIDAVRRFNRFYTQRIGALNEGLLSSRFSLAEARILYELAHRERLTAAGLARELGLDPGYLSRLLRGFARAGLIDRTASPTDGRQRLLSLTAAGKTAFAPLDRASHDEVGRMIAGLSPDEQARLCAAMARVERLLGAPAAPGAPYLLRPHRPGDLGWVMQGHGALYGGTFGWDQEFEALVAEVLAGFIRNFEPARDCCWIAERHGERVGSVFVVAQSPDIESPDVESPDVAQLRLLLVEPAARGLGIGARLVEECLSFARRAGYRTMILWTYSMLVAARRIYERAGFRLVEATPQRRFGHDLVAEKWQISL